jgi:murein DD-endopeptidase MepM/ murein hydrolase activator NlpD
MKKFIQKTFSHLKKRYRVELIDEETLSSSKRYYMRPLVWTVGVATLLVGLIVGTASTIWYTPSIRQQIPGYSNPDNEQKLLTMQSEISNLEKELSQKDNFIQGMQKALDEAPPSSTEENVSVKEIKEAKSSTEEKRPTPASASKEKDAQAKTDKEKNNKIVNTPAAPIPAQPSPGDLPAAKPSSKVALAVKTILRPVIGYVREGFSAAKGHYGIDIITNANETVLAATEGFVQLSEYTEADGYIIAISNPSGLTTIYKHNSQLLKRKGNYVHAGEPIAVVGNTGENSTGPHLHFEIWHNGEPLNPRDYVFFK